MASDLYVAPRSLPRRKLRVTLPRTVLEWSVGVLELAHAGFVLVAGGLGERLGYNVCPTLPLAEPSLLAGRASSWRSPQIWPRANAFSRLTAR